MCTREDIPIGQRLRISHSFEGVSLNAELISFNVFHIQQSGNEITFHRVERSHVLILVYSSCKMRLYIDRMLWSRMLAVAIEGNNKLSISRMVRGHPLLAPS